MKEVWRKELGNVADKLVGMWTQLDDIRKAGIGHVRVRDW